MTIHVLSPQLANQIATGEVMEGPASIARDLPENAIDAGNTDIRIDVEKGAQNVFASVITAVVSVKMNCHWL
ncbi:hypothetical protein FPE53_23825 [Salmonella enterica subsp. enterica]|uniref:Uncharacterized protein n=2 Tax=Salmonella enterica TaxID=28901 RepID=A0A744QI14_SALER|nr:hypothetical protein [Salmonella enterica subsp. enterica serovar Aqua]ECH1172221.1 hypothetical protein [Salmonella enterica subsp. enterica serovar Aqua]HAF2609305.1 hypothetical protein [Salmonella enterica]